MALYAETVLMKVRAADSPRIVRITIEALAQRAELLNVSLVYSVLTELRICNESDFYY